jgi:hypothetical protein
MRRSLSHKTNYYLTLVLSSKYNQISGNFAGQLSRFMLSQKTQESGVKRHMRRILSILVLITAFILPIATSCVPGGYEGKNPGRPDENQVDVNSLQQDGTPAEQPPAEQPPADQGTTDQGTTEQPSGTDDASGTGGGN